MVGRHVDGNIAAGGPSVAALNALRAIQTFDDKKQGTLDAMAYSASVGVTTNVDMGGFVIPGTPNVQDSVLFDGLASWDPFTAYDPLLALYDEARYRCACASSSSAWTTHRTQGLIRPPLR